MAGTALTHLEILPVPLEQAPILANLLELYVHDFSEFLDVEIGEDGRFGYPALSLYWSEPDRHPFFIKLDGTYAGLVLVKRECAVWDMAEFFILRGCRRRGIGTQVAHEVWKRLPGLWEVRVMEANVSARRFWAGAVAMFVGEAIQPVCVEKGGKRWEVFSFQSSSTG